jgi:hypothetical protein
MGVNTRRIPTYLYLREQLAASVLQSEAGAGATIVFTIAATGDGAPSAIGSLTASVSSTSGSPATYSTTFTASALQTALSASYVGRMVYLHIGDSLNTWREVYPLLVTDTDPDTLPVPTPR